MIRDFVMRERTGKRKGLGKEKDWEKKRTGKRKGLGKEKDWEKKRTGLTICK
jgi:hypothetical protein